MKITSADEVRAQIARAVLGDAEADAHLGDVTLHDHQREGVARVARLLEEHGGALLADDVGLGKTFVALAVARRANRVLVIAPAALRRGWLDSAAKARVPMTFASVQSLARGVPAGGFDLVIVDEAHHLRSRNTLRFASAVAVCRAARVLLMTATPIQNRLADLRTVLSLFLGQRAFVLEAPDLAAFVVRRLERDVPGAGRPLLPRIVGPTSLPAIADVECLDRLLALPPPLAAAEGGDGGVLLTFSLVRQWASSRAALRGALRRRLARGHAMEDALAAGRLPTARELHAWCYADGAQQLAFPELLIAADAALRGTPSTLLQQARVHAQAVRELLAWLARTPDPDIARASAVAHVLDAHPAQRVVAFSEYADTVTALYRALASRGRIAMLTHAGARIAGGRTTRAELLSHFGPHAAERPAERMDLLLTTDLLSEGVNLQSASVLVHLDLAWNPARLEQRVGRLRRFGAAGDTVSVYVLPPPASSERLLQLERRLRVKLGVASRTIGIAGPVLPGAPSLRRDGAHARREQRIATMLARWRDGARLDAATSHPAIAAVSAAEAGALVCVAGGNERTLICCRHGVVTDAREHVEAMVAAADGGEAIVDIDVARVTVQQVTAWLGHREVTGIVSLPHMRLARLRRAVLRRVETIVRRAPRHAQPRLASFMQAARAAAGATLSAGAERVLHELAAAPLDDDAWLHAMSEFATLNVGARTPARLLAILLLTASPSRSR